MIFKQFLFNSVEYQQALILRENILRKPLGLSLSQDDLVDEDKQFHFGLFDENTLLACVLFKPVSADKLKLRQMAVSEEHQGKGLGKLIIQNAENELVKLCFSEIEMAARETAIPFYQKLGYQIKGTLFQQAGIPHITMVKRLL